MNTNYCKTPTLLGCLIAAWLSVGEAQAAIFTSVGGWRTSGSFTDQDKKYTFVSATLPDTTTITFQTFVFPGLDIHTVFNGPVPRGVYTLNYQIDIVPVAGEIPKIFDTVSLDSDVPSAAPDVRVTKVIRDHAGATLGTLVSLSGNPSALLDVEDLHLTELQISMTYRVDQGDVLFLPHPPFPANRPAPGILSSATDTYTEVDLVVPEPASLVLWGGLGALGLAFGWRKRRGTAGYRGDSHGSGEPCYEI